MKRSTGLSSRMSNYDYAGKKNTWKWTPAKIAAFSMFGVMIGTIIYFESNSSRNSFETPVPVNDGPSLSVQTIDFDKEYQEFLKRGKKIVDEETLDSIIRIQSIATTQPLANKTPNSNIKPTNTQPKPTTKSPALTPVPTQTPEVTTTENNFELIELTPLENKSDVIALRVDKDESITEEFYIEETITGSIASLADRTPLQGVTVTVKGTNRSVLSDSNGRYSIAVPGDPQQRTLQYSFRGNVTERDVSPGTDVINIRF